MGPNRKQSSTKTFKHLTEEAANDHRRASRIINHFYDSHNQVVDAGDLGGEAAKNLHLEVSRLGKRFDQMMGVLDRLTADMTLLKTAMKIPANQSKFKMRPSLIL